MIYYDIHRSFTEYVAGNLGTQTGEVVRFEFPTSELGSHTYSIQAINYMPRQINGRAVGGTANGRVIESLVQIDTFRMPTSGQPDVAGSLKMASRVGDMFKGTHFIPLKSYGSSPTGATAGTVSGAIKVSETEDTRPTFDPDPLVRRMTQLIKLETVEKY